MVMNNAAENIYNQLCSKHKENILANIENYKRVFQEYLMLIAEAEAGIYVGIVSVNGDTRGEKESAPLVKKLKEIEGKLIYSINSYKKISGNKNKIIARLDLYIQQNNRDMGTIVNEINEIIIG